MMFLMYFLCLGAGYILIQVALIQRFVLLLGHPTYALTVIVFSMLVASGAGSFFSARVMAGDDARLVRVLAESRCWCACSPSALGPGQRRRRMADAGEDADHRSRDRPGRVPHGHAVPQRPAAAGAMAFGVCAGLGR